jgi:cytochrome c553
MRVMEARARLDSALASLGGDEFAIWETIADVTKFDALVDGVDRKVDALQRVAERRVQQAAATRARRTSTILSGLTALTVAIALIDYLLGGRSDTPVEVARLVKPRQPPATRPAVGVAQRHLKRRSSAPSATATCCPVCHGTDIRATAERRRLLINRAKRQTQSGRH